MKISNIEKDSENVYYVTFTPNLIQRLFGMKNVIKTYKEKKGSVYKYLQSSNVFYSSDGEILSPFSKECQALNNFQRRF